MNEKKILGDKAVSHFEEGYNCAQSVLLTLFEHWNGKSRLVPAIATGFGGGIGRCGSLCGALTGGVMAIGARCGTNEPSGEMRAKAYELASRFYKLFESRCGSVSCRELLGYDLSNAKDREEAREAKVFEKKCLGFVRTAVEIILELAEH